MDEARAAKLALARKKLKDHQVKKTVCIESEEHFQKKHEVKNIEEQTLIEVTKPEPCILEPIVNVTEMLIASKRDLETEISELRSKLSKLDYDRNEAIKENNISQQQINNIQSELTEYKNHLNHAQQELHFKSKIIEELQGLKTSLTNANNNLTEQLDFTKTMLASKQSENTTLMNQLQELEKKLDATQVQLQQLTHGAQNVVAVTCQHEDIEPLIQKNAQLEQQAKKLQKEKDQINSHCEHYIAELNQQLNSIMHKNEQLSKEVERLSIRETSLIEQISDMEIRVLNYKIRSDENLNSNQTPDKNYSKELQQNFEKAQAELHQLTEKYNALQKQYLASEAKIIELSQSQQCEHSNQQDNISMSKLHADITSDKIAAQRATEQNKKLKFDIQQLEEAFVKMSQDKLELTEKLTAEKYLNRELTIKLAEIDEKAKDMHVKLYAKDEEMIRLLTNYKNIETKYEEICKKITQGPFNDSEPTEAITGPKPANNNELCNHSIETDNASPIIPTEDAMMKLQKRFLKIMGDVADLSDEKHRLEHIILQLQNETDTICEYVALYQQQRSLLKKRDEERSAQMKIFQSECDRLKAQLEELSVILRKFADDKELSSYFKTETRENDIHKVMNLLANLKQNSLIDPHKNNLDFHNFYPCSCCSGKLIEV